ncbi:MAG: DUF4351 domain-containing protein [Gemmataceae bacterium]
MNKTVYDEGLEQGLEQGLERGLEQGRRKERLELIHALLEERFGPLAPELREQLEHLSMDELRRLALRIVKASSLAELGLPGSNAD